MRTVTPHIRHWWIPFVLLLCCLPLYGQSEEGDNKDNAQVESFNSVLTLRPDATLQVTEKITFLSTRTTFLNGITRSFPLSYPTRFGLRCRLELTDIQVTSDDPNTTQPGKESGTRISYTYQRDWNGQRILMGENNAILKPGEHTFTLSYQLAPEIAYFRDHDTLVWDVTGFDWPVSVNQASAVVKLPRVTNGNGISAQGMIGKRGSREIDTANSDVQAAITELGEVNFTLTKPLATPEGLRLLVKFPPGVVTPPAFNALFFFQDNPTLFWVLLATLVMLSYYITLWTITVRETAGGQIVPRSTPPEGVSPAVARYLRTGTCDHRMLASALADMAVKRGIKLTKNGTVYSVAMLKEDLVRERDRRATTGDEQSKLELTTLTSEERALLASLLLSGPSFTFIPENHGVIQEAMQRFTRILKAKYEALYFTAPTRFVVIGAVVSLLAMIGIGFADASHSSWREATHSVEGLVMTGVGVYLLGTVMLKAWQHALSQTIEQFWAIIQTLFSTVLVLACTAGGIYLLRYSSSMQMVMLLVVLGIINLVFAFLLRRRTAKGQRIHDQLEGFLLFLTTGRIDHRREKKPERTTELFERYLPYAIALEVERAWSDQFIYHLQRNEECTTAYCTEWFQVLDQRPLNFRAFIQALGSEFPKAITAASLSTSTMMDEPV